MKNFLTALLLFICMTVFGQSFKGVNFFYTRHRWIDEKYSGLLFGSNPSQNPPSRVEVEAGTGIYGLAWEHADTGSFSIQFQHGTAATNDYLPQFYYEPHAHISGKSLASGTNVQFKISFQIAAINTTYSNSVVNLTNTIRLTNTSFHQVLSFGYVTNNSLQSRDSIVAKGEVTRLNSGAGDVGNTATVFIDSLDFHIPLNNLGSQNIQ